MSDIVKILPYSIDLNETIKPTELHTLFVVGDNQAHRFELEIKRGSEAVDLSGATVTGYFTNFKEKTTIEVPGKAEDGKVIVTLKKLCYTLHGQFVLLIQVKTGDVDATIFQGDGFMRASKAEKIVFEDFVIYDMNTLLAQISAMKTATKEANDATAASVAQTAAAKEATDDANDAAEGADGWARATISAEKLAAGSDPTADVNTAEDGHKVITLGIPKGDTGATPQITFDVETGLPGTDVQIAVSGTAEKPHVHLTIPRGNTGSTENMPFYNSAPKALGSDANPGTSEDVARGDHVHPMPTASQVGARPNTWTPSAADVGARPNTWTPSAADVGALAKDAQAADSAKLGGNAPEYYMPDYGRNAVLWEGEWSSGTITVPNTSRYTGFQIFMVGISSTILAMKHVDRIRGLGGFASEENSNITTYSFSASYSGDTWTFNACRGGNNERTVSKIVGLF